MRLTMVGVLAVTATCSGCGASRPRSTELCVEPLAHLDARLAREGIEESQRGAVIEHEPRIDLDGDGDLDHAISRGAMGGSGGYEWSLYLVDGPCAQPAGSMSGRGIDVVEHHGARVLETEIWGGSSSQERVRFLVHAGAEPEVIARRECRSVEDPTGEVAEISSCERASW